MTTQKIVKINKPRTLSPVENVKLFKACELNHNRKTYNKLWIDVKSEALEIVEDLGKRRNSETNLLILNKDILSHSVKKKYEKENIYMVHYSPPDWPLIVLITTYSRSFFF